ncbi:MAG: nicotinate-nucleotide adenylyltransferase [Lysobacterales bacterium]|jgi:nicotinate-nucleotide adenylyltransferase
MTADAPLGLFGGTFDPVHFGHLRAAYEAMERLGLESLTLLPAGTPPHRGAPMAPAEQRLAMLRLAIEPCSAFRIDDREVRREGYSYMVDTLEDIRRESAAARPLLLLIGQDAANTLDSWHRWQTLFELCHIVVMRRPEFHFSCSGELLENLQDRRVNSLGQLMSRPAGGVWSLETTQLDISSSAIRALFAVGRSPRFLLPDSVIGYIAAHGLYT